MKAGGDESSFEEWRLLESARNNRRSYYRYPVELPVEIEIEQLAGKAVNLPPVRARVCDISGAGLGVLSSLRVPVGTRVRVRFIFPPLDAMGAVRAEVRRSTLVEDGLYNWGLSLDLDRESQFPVLQSFLVEQFRKWEGRGEKPPQPKLQAEQNRQADQEASPAAASSTEQEVEDDGEQQAD